MEKTIELQKEGEEKNITIARENITIGGGNVNSVNGQTGDVILTTSDLENTSGYQTRAEVASAISDAVAGETDARQAADTNLQSQIDGITASSDVTDIVGTYAGLQEYDTTTLSNNDIIKVLQDESQNDETTYYRWSTETQSFTLIGEEGPYYTKSQTDTLLGAKQNLLTAGDGIDITNDTISVDTDTIQEKLTAGTGIDITDNTISATGGGGPTVVQTTGTSTTDVMSQNAVTSMVFKDPSTQEIVKIGKNAVAGSSRNVAVGYFAYGGNSSASYAVAVGGQSYAPNQDAVALGGACNAQANGSIAIGRNATVYSGVVYGQAIGYNSKANSGHEYSVALGAHANTTRAGEVNVGTGSTTNGYDNTSYRVIGGVHDGQDAHDATTVGQVNTRLGGLTLIPITQAAYDALATKDANTLYVITGA